MIHSVSSRISSKREVLEVGIIKLAESAYVILREGRVGRLRGDIEPIKCVSRGLQATGSQELLDGVMGELYDPDRVILANIPTVTGVVVEIRDGTFSNCNQSGTGLICISGP